MPGTGAWAVSPIGSARSSGAVTSSSASGTNCRPMPSSGSDQLGDLGGDRHRVARRHPFEGRQPLRRHQPARREIARAPHRPRSPGYSARGVQITSSIRRAPVASITSRSKPSAMPPPSGICPSALRKSSSRGSARRRPRSFSSISAAKRPALLGRVGQFAERVGELDAAGIEFEPLRHPRIGGARPGERGFRIGYSHRIVARPRPRAGSTRSTITRLNRSAQVSSGAVRMPASLSAARRAPAGRCRHPAPPSPGGRSRHGAGRPPPR